MTIISYVCHDLQFTATCVNCALDTLLLTYLVASGCLALAARVARIETGTNRQTQRQTHGHHHCLKPLHTTWNAVVEL